VPLDATTDCFRRGIGVGKGFNSVRHPHGLQSYFPQLLVSRTISCSRIVASNRVAGAFACFNGQGSFESGLAAVGCFEVVAGTRQVQAHFSHLA